MVKTFSSILAGFLAIAVISLLRGDAAAWVLDCLAVWLADMSENDMLAPLVSLSVCVVSVISSSAIAVYSNRKTQKRELERDLRDSFFTFYDPLLSLIEPLSEYLGSDETSSVDLASYDPEISAHRRKLVKVSAFAKGIEDVFQSGKSSLSATNSDLSRDLSMLRFWVLAVS